MEESNWKAQPDKDGFWWNRTKHREVFYYAIFELYYRGPYLWTNLGGEREPVDEIPGEWQEVKKWEP